MGWQLSLQHLAIKHTSIYRKKVTMVIQNNIRKRQWYKKTQGFKFGMWVYGFSFFFFHSNPFLTL